MLIPFDGLQNSARMAFPNFLKEKGLNLREPCGPSRLIDHLFCLDLQRPIQLLIWLYWMKSIQRFLVGRTRELKYSMPLLLQRWKSGRIISPVLFQCTTRLRSGFAITRFGRCVNLDMQPESTLDSAT